MSKIPEIFYHGTKDTEIHGENKIFANLGSLNEIFYYGDTEGTKLHGVKKCCALFESLREKFYHERNTCGRFAGKP